VFLFPLPEKKKKGSAPKSVERKASLCKKLELLRPGAGRRKDDDFPGLRET